MGIFDFLRNSINSINSSAAPSSISEETKSAKQELYENNAYFKKMTDNLDYQNKLLNEVNAAQAQYKKDGDLDTVICALEKAFIKSNPPCRSSQCMDLAKYYIKAGRNNDAWGYLNSLILSENAPIDKIRFEMARILKKEDKHVDAIEMIMLGHLKKSEWNRDFQKDKFLKDIGPSVKKLNWSSEQTNQLADMIEKKISKNNFDESSLAKDFKEWYKWQ